MSARVRTAVLISGRGSNMAALIEAARAPDFPAEIALVVSDKADAGALRSPSRGHRHGGDRPQRSTRGATNSRPRCRRAATYIASKSSASQASCAFSARAFVNRWRGRMINIHPSLLPAYRGLHTHERALADGVKEHGCTVHFVEPELDARAGSDAGARARAGRRRRGEARRASARRGASHLSTGAGASRRARSPRRIESSGRAASPAFAPDAEICHTMMGARRRPARSWPALAAEMRRRIGAARAARNGDRGP